MAKSILSGIYKIENTINGKCYIGSSMTITKRWWAHKKRLTERCHHSQHLQNAWNKYGDGAFAFSILEIVERRENLVSIEQQWIDRLHPEYNIAQVAGSPLGVKHSAESSLKKSIALKGIKRSEETLQKLKAAAVGRRPPVTPEIIAKRAAKLRGKIRPKEAVEKTRLARLGSKHTDEAKRLMSESRRGVKKPSMSDEHKKKLSIALIGKTVSLESKAKMSASAKLRGAPVLTKEQRATGDAKRRGVKRSEEAIQRMKDAYRRRIEAKQQQAA